MKPTISLLALALCCGCEKQQTIESSWGVIHHVTTTNVIFVYETNYVIATITNEVPRIIWAYTNCPPEPQPVLVLTNLSKLYLDQYGDHGYTPTIYRIDDEQWKRLTNFFNTNYVNTVIHYKFYAK